MKFSVSAIIIITCFFFYCNNKNSQRPLNPNGDSELAVLMRQMFDEGMVAKQAVLNEEAFTKILQHEKILTAEPTEAGQNESAQFKAFANNYLSWMKQLNDPNIHNKKEVYSNLVNGCVQCHKAICPGPLVRINKMLIE